MADERRAEIERSGDSDRGTAEQPGAVEAGATLKRALYEAAERIESTLAEAERTADEIRAAAVDEAERYVRDRSREADLLLADRVAGLAELNESLRERRERLRARLDQVAGDLDQLGQTIDEIARPRGEAEAQPGPDRPSAAANGDRARPQVAVAYPGSATPADRPGPAGERDRDTALVLRAAQMAIAGASKDEVKRRLSDEYSSDEAELAVDDVFGRH